SVDRTSIARPSVIIQAFSNAATLQIRNARSTHILQQLGRSAEQSSVFRTDQAQSRHQRITDERDDNQAHHSRERDLTKAKHKDPIGDDACKRERGSKGQEVPGPYRSAAGGSKQQQRRCQQSKTQGGTDRDANHAPSDPYQKRCHIDDSRHQGEVSELTGSVLRYQQPETTGVDPRRQPPNTQPGKY